MSAFGAALGAALSPAAVDPKLVWMYTGLTVACFVAGIMFWLLYQHLNDAEDAMNELQQFGDQGVPVEDVPIAIRKNSVTGEKA